MVNESVSSLRTNSSSPGLNEVLGDSRGKDANNDSESSNFSSILGKANAPQKSAPARHGAKAPVATKLDKPKVGSRDPFFPATPVPFHPDASGAQAPREAVRESREASQAGEGIEGIPTDGVHAKADVGIARARLDQRAPGSISGQPTVARAGTGSTGPNEVGDDEDGVMSDSYDGAAVSYPVSRIARESLDDDTKEDLQAQGLWNLPTMVMAQPNAKMASMSESAQAIKGVKGMGMRKSCVPVQKPIAQFMASLENDLGVSPDRLVQAFQKLPPGQMALPPEQTMVQVIKNLDLPQDEAATAMQAYSKMLAQMQMLDQPERMHAAPLVMGGLTTAKVEQQLESANLVKPEAKSVAGKYAMQLPEGMVKAEGQPAMSRPDAQGYEGLKGAGFNLDKASAQDTSSSFGNQIGNAAQEVNGQSQNNLTGFDQSSNQSFGDGQSRNGAAGFAAQAGSGATVGNASNPGKDVMAVDGKRESAAKTLAVKEGSVRGVADSVNTNTATQGAQDLKPLRNVGAPATAAGTTGAAAELKTESQARHEAIQHIVSNAQLLAQKGGGEMKLTLKPDHMGEIQLRVAMEGNKVNVQMTAEKSEVKKLIEQSVHELRSGLAQHNFSMEKLDVSLTQKDAGNQFQGKQPDFGAAQDFFNQFHQQQGNRRQMMAGMSELGSPVARRNSSSGALSASAAAGFGGSGGTRTMGSSRLNVVA